MEPGALIGRSAALAGVDRALEAARRGPAVVVEVVGEPGIGKTRLLAELAERAERRGFQVRSGRGGELERTLPFGLVVDALDRSLGELEPGRLNALRAEARAQLGGVFPALAHFGAPAGGLSEERHQAHYAIRALLELLASRKPLVLALDDVHWADQASLELLAHLMRRPPRAALAIAVAYRPTQAPAALPAALLDAERAGTVERIALGPLTAAESDELLGEALDAPTRRALYRDSGGNPFYLEQLARAAGRARAAATDPGIDRQLPDVPRIVLSALADEVSALAPRVQVTARAAAVAGETFGPDLVADIAEARRADVLADVDTLIECDLIRPAVPARFRFRHPIVRRAVYDSAPAAWLVGAHARAARTLERREASAAARAHHVERSAAPGDEAAIAVLTEAANASLTLAPGTAARFYEAALRLLGDGDAERRLALLVPLATALGTSGELETSRETLREIVGQLSADQPLQTRVVAVLAAVEHLLGRYEEANALLAATFERLPEGPSSEGGALLLELAAGRYFEGDWTWMGEHAAQARGHAAACGEDGQLAEATAMLALSACALGDGELAREELAAAARMIDGLDDERLARHLDACFWLSLGEVHLGRYADAVRHLERGIELSRRTGQGWLLVQYHALLAATFTLDGRLERAQAESREAVDVARLSGVPNLVGWAQMAFAWWALRAGDLGEAIAAGEDVERLLGRWPTVPMMGGICTLAEARVETGAPEHGRDTLLAIYGGADLDGLEPIFRPWAYEVLTRAELAAGRVDAAAAWAARACDAAAVLGLGRDRASAFTAAAAVALARGDGPGAFAAAREAARAADESGSPIHAGRARILAGEALALAGDRDGALQTLDEAHRQLAACGAARYAGEAAGALRRLGRRLPRVGAGHSLAGLSEREAEIARLVAERLTNREIAARLFVSEKTVERHLHSVFRKLAVDSRVKVARAVEREREPA